MKTSGYRKLQIKGIKCENVESLENVQVTVRSSMKLGPSMQRRRGGKLAGIIYRSVKKKKGDHGKGMTYYYVL